MKKLTERRKSSSSFFYPSNFNNNNVELPGMYERNLVCRKGSIQPITPNSNTPSALLREAKTPPAIVHRKSSLAFLFPFSSSASHLDEFSRKKSKSKTSLCNLSLEDQLPDEEDYLCEDHPSPSTPVCQEEKNKTGRTSRRSSLISPLSDGRLMGRAMRVIVAGAKKCGKTAILRQVACLEDVTKTLYQPTLDDTYQVLLEEADRPREILVFHDTAGVPEYGPVELRRPYIQVADAFVLVYSVIDHESFNRMDLLKRYIEKQFGKEKKEVPIVVLGTMCDLPGRKVDYEFAQNWAHRERVRLFEVTAADRNTLVDFVHYLGQRHFHPQKDSLKFSLSKKLKSEKSNAAILMDF